MKVENIGTRMKGIRKFFNLSQKEFADLLGVTQTTISGIETNRANPSLSLIKFICMQYGVNEDWLLRGNGEMMAVSAPKEAVSDRAEKFVRCDECDYCKWSEESGMYLCSDVQGMNGALDPKGGDGCSHGRR